MMETRTETDHPTWHSFARARHGELAARGWAGGMSALLLVLAWAFLGLPEVVTCTVASAMADALTVRRW